MTSKHFILLLGSAGLLACGEGGAPLPSGPTGPLAPYHAQTLRFGASDNLEVVKVQPGGAPRAIAVASKARKVILLEVGEAGLVEVASRVLFEADPSESELTHIDFGLDGTWAVLTRTKVIKDGAGETVDCGGSVVFVDTRPGASFGDVLAELEVGPMPDAVSVSPDGLWVATANERDVVWGKCEAVVGLEPPSVSLIDVSGGVANAVERRRVYMSEAADREPEHIVFSNDSSMVIATLQDSHEVLLLPVAAAVATASATEALGTVTRLPANAIDQDPWPDGITHYVDASGTELFVAAGEANDAFDIVDITGQLRGHVEIPASDIPADFPRDGSWGPLFRPDSAAAFVRDGAAHLALSLKASGAVGIWDVSDPDAVKVVAMVKVGDNDTAGPDEESSLGTEGITASSEHGFIITVNELESSASLVRF